jgi:thiol-disulfide isomerase/thioredoxin
MYRMKFFLAYIFCLQVLVGISQQTEISGTAIGHPDEMVRIVVYADQFSKLDSTLVKAKTDIWGNFSFPVVIEKTTYAFLALGLKRGDFYLEPGNAYQFQILDDTIKGSVFDQLPLQFNLLAEKDSLNQMIGQFNYKYNVFLYEKQREIMRAKDKSVIRQFVKEMKEEFSAGTKANNDYLKNYVNYTLASLEWISKSKSDSAILMDYFVNQEVLRENIAYTDLFRDFFKMFFKTQKLFEYHELVSSFHSEQISNIDSLLKRDDLLALDEELRELSLLTLLARNYHNPDVSKESILKLFRQIENLSKYVKNRTAAKNYRYKLTYLQYGSKAIPFNLSDPNGVPVGLSEFEGQFVLLDFISSDCAPCFYDLVRLLEIQQNLANKLNIVVIVTDGNLKKAMALYNGNHQHITWLNLDDNILVLESYEVKTFPSYVLINPDATIAMAPAPPPNESLEAFIKGFMVRYQNNK